MKPVRVNTLVVDTSVFSKRPSPAELKVFFDTKLHLDMSNVKRIQLHNIKNVVYLGMRDMTVANRIAAEHHLKHRMVVDGKEVPILVPVYIETSATDVRLHDLPEEIDTDTIIKHMSQYGEVISIRDELWKNYWPGFANGVTVVRMRLACHIPSYINFEDFEESATVVSYRTQIRTCFKCCRKAHPKQRCSDAAAAEKQTVVPNEMPIIATTQPTSQPSTLASKANKTIQPAAGSSSSNNEKTTQLNQLAFPALPNTSPVPPAAVAAKKKKQIQQNKTPRIKRQCSEEQQTANKKTSGNNSSNVSGEDLYDTDSTDAVFIFEDMLSQCDISQVPGSDVEQKKDQLQIIARHLANRNRERLRQKK